MKRRKTLAWREQHSSGRKAPQRAVREKLDNNSAFPDSSEYELGELFPVCLLLIFRSHLWEDRNQREQEERSDSLATSVLGPSPNLPLFFTL